MTNQVTYWSDRIGIKKGEEELTVYIKSSSKTDQKKLRYLKMWAIAWTIIGLIVISQLFFPYSREEKLYFVVYLAFWAYFEYRVLYAYYFRQYGIETIYVNNGKIFLRRDILNKKGKPKYFTLHRKNPFFLTEDAGTGFFQQMGNSFWSIRGGKIAFGEKPKEYRFGLQLPEADANRLVKLLNESIRVKAKTE